MFHSVTHSAFPEGVFTRNDFLLKLSNKRRFLSGAQTLVIVLLSDCLFQCLFCFVIMFLGAEALRVEFDRQCSTERRHDPLTIMDGAVRTVSVRSGQSISHYEEILTNSRREYYIFSLTCLGLFSVKNRTKFLAVNNFSVNEMTTK